MTKRGLGWGLGLVAFVSVFGASGLAQAATVDCESEFGSCEVSNDGVDSITCSCGEASGTGMTGGDELDGLDEEELLAICETSLEICEFEGSGESGPMTTTVGTDTESGTDTETSATSIADTGDPTDSATGPGTTGATSESGTGESGTTDADTTAAETTDAETTAAETTDAESTGVSATGASATGASATGASATGSSDSDDETSSSGAGENEDSSGCSCDASGRDRSGLLGFGLLAALGLRRRRG